jgi:ABC-type lipoprotein release transport system permease subunit
MPTAAAVKAARTVIGVVHAQPRIWGLASGPNGRLTVIGLDSHMVTDLLGIGSLPPILPGQAIVGPGTKYDPAQAMITLTAVTGSNFEIIATLPDTVGLFAHDLVLLTAADARNVLGIPNGHASDLAISVFHDAEVQSMLGELAAAFPWPVRLTTRQESLGAYLDGYNRHSTISLLMSLPTILAMALLIAVGVRKAMGSQTKIGILKAVGWTTADIVRWQLWQSVLIALPSAIFGMLIAATLVYWPGAAWIGKVIFGWPSSAPKLYLESTGAFVTLITVAGCVLVPVIVAALIPMLKAATTDVRALLDQRGIQQ